MIQRIQTLWLLLAFIGLTMVFVFPAVTFHSETVAGYAVDGALNLIPKHNPDMLAQIESGGDVVMDQSGYIHTWPLAVLAGLAAVLALVCIFMFRNRVLQMRMVAVAFLVNVVYVFLLLFWGIDKFDDAFKAFAAQMGCDGASMSYTLGTWLPLVTIVLLMMAQRGIKKDEAKVRAADRLR